MKKNYTILAIESSCDETSCAVVVDGRTVLSNVVSSQIDIHTLFGGVVPEVASRNHITAIDNVVNEALKEANKTLDDIDAIAVTYGAGLVGCLLVGISYAKALSFATGKPLIAVNHINGHIASNYITYEDLKPPFICLVVSGGHSELVLMDKEYSFTLLGETKDDAIGECYDKVSRVLGLGYPGGPIIDKLASIGSPIYELPYPKVEGKYNFSFSGLKTAVLNLVNNMRQKGIEFKNEDVAASFQKKVIDILLDKVLLALKEYDIKQVMLAGGVSANKELREEIVKRVNKKDKSIEIVLPPLWCCTDNAAMTAMAGYYSNENQAQISDGVNPNLGLND